MSSSSSTKTKVGGPPTVTPTQTKVTASKQPSSSAAPSSTRSSRSKKSLDPQHAKILDLLEKYRVLYAAEPENVFAALNVADTLRRLDLTYHDGGSRQVEALEIYAHAIQLTLKKREQMLANGEPTKMNLSGTTSVPDEIMMENSAKSVDGLLCSIYTSKGKQYFMANMFEKAVAEYTNCIEIEPLYLDAVGSRGSTRIILGQYKEAGEDFQICLENDKNRMFNDVFTGMAKVLSAKEEAVPSGWGPMIEILDSLIPQLEMNMANQAANEYAQNMFAESLARLHHVMFMYHDTKTKDVEQAWHHLETGFKFKMSVLPPYPAAFEKQKLQTTKGVFHHGFWPANVGSDTLAPIFIIGFVRSGSTLLERVLDAHPLVVGTGEDSVSNI
jgi:tetratricopeptide (TPR) repeat protein